MKQPEFYDQLQDFCKFFLSVEQDCDPDEIKPVSLIKNSEGKEKPVFYEFDKNFIYNSEKSKKNAKTFKNISSDKIKNKKSSVFFSEENKNMWILKPSDLSRGRGLEIFNSLDELKNHLKDYFLGYSVKMYKNYQVDYEKLRGILFIKILEIENKEKNDNSISRRTQQNKSKDIF